MGKRRRKGWMCTMNFCLRQLGTLEFWETLLDSFGNLGPIAPIMLAMVESFFPPLPLIAIVALNVAAHGGILGFLYSWAGVALGGSIMFLFWRRVVKCFFWKFASRSPKLEKAQQWVNRFDTSSLFMLALLPFAPSSFMHLAFGISDFDEKRYLITMLLGKGVMIAMMAVFGQSLVSSMKNPLYLVLAVLLWGGMYWVSKQFCKKVRGKSVRRKLSPRTRVRVAAPSIRFATACVLLAAAPTTPPCFCHWQQSSLLQHLNTAEAARQVHHRAADFAIRG